MTPRALTLRTRFFLAFLGLALVPLVGASLLAAGTGAQALRDKIGTYSLQIVDQIALNLEGQFQKIKGLTDDVLISPEVSSRMVGYPAAPAGDQAMTRFIFGKLLQTKFLNLAYVDDVIMRFRAGSPGSDTIHATGQGNWAADRPVTSGLTLVSLPGSSKIDIALVRPVRNSLADETLGSLMVVLDPEFFVRVFRSVDVGQGSDLFVVDAAGRVVASRNPQRPVGSQAVPAAWVKPGTLPFVSAWEGQEHLFSVASLGGTGWSVVGAVPSSYLDSETGKLTTQVLLFALVAAALALLVSLRISRGFAAPLRHLEQAMGLFGEGMMQVRSPVGRDDEIGRLQTSFNAMAADIERLMKGIEEEHRRRQLSELQVLEYQINPHFLYNTLDSINWMAQRAGQKEISAVVTALARFFRLSLSRGRETYRVQDELDHVKAFLSISQMRYPDTFTFVFDVAPELLERHTLKIVLQPLVENAVKHGIDKRGSGGVIRVEGRAAGRELEWVVADNGKGMTDERLEALRRRLSGSEPGSEPDSDTGGFGLVNVHHRIQLNYGAPYGLSIESAPGDGTRVRALLPLEDEISNVKQNL
jgi:two-component system sensor histidine kinase YesM